MQQTNTRTGYKQIGGVRWTFAKWFRIMGLKIRRSSCVADDGRTDQKYSSFDEKYKSSAASAGDDQRTEKQGVSTIL